VRVTQVRAGSRDGNAPLDPGQEREHLVSRLVLEREPPRRAGASRDGEHLAVRRRQLEAPDRVSSRPGGSSSGTPSPGGTSTSSDQGRRTRRSTTRADRGRGSDVPRRRRRATQTRAATTGVVVTWKEAPAWDRPHGTYAVTGHERVVHPVGPANRIAAGSRERRTPTPRPERRHALLHRAAGRTTRPARPRGPRTGA